MNITITSGSIEIDQKLKLHIEKKLFKIAKQASIVDSGNEAHVEISLDTRHHQKGDIYKVEINLHTKGKTHRTDAVKSDIRKSFDMASDSLSSELRSHYKKQNTLFKKGAQKIKDFLRKK